MCSKSSKLNLSILAGWASDRQKVNKHKNKSETRTYTENSSAKKSKYKEN